MKPVSSATATDSVMVLSVREVRMIVERILLTTGLPDGLVPAVRDCILYSQAMGLGGMAALRRDYALLKQASPAVMRLVEGGDGTMLDAAGQHAWIVAPNLIDLALAQARSGKNGKMHVRDVTAISELGLLRGYAGRFGARADVIPEGEDGATIRVVADGLGDSDNVMQAALNDGMPIPKLLWEELYAKSHDALTPDSIVSRRHAGPVMVDAEGRVHGRDDDDTDFSLLGVKPANSAAENA